MSQVAAVAAASSTWSSERAATARAVQMSSPVGISWTVVTSVGDVNLAVSRLMVFWMPVLEEPPPPATARSGRGWREQQVKRGVLLIWVDCLWGKEVDTEDIDG